MKVLCTFSGKYGDILWSLPTARQIAKDVAGGKVDFATMPYYESLRPLIATQEYIDECFVIPNWIRTHSNHGDGPAESPKEKILISPSGMTMDGATVQAKIGDYQSLRSYDKIYDLTYKGHPGINAPNMPLLDFTAWQQGMTLQDPIPFLRSDPGCLNIISRPYLSYAFNEQYQGEKAQFAKAFLDGLEFITVNVSELPWADALRVIDGSLLFVGCRSANWVLAMGLGKETITFEPHPSRHANCHLGKVFGCPYGKETCLPWGLPPVVAGQTAAAMVKKRMEEWHDRNGRIDECDVPSEKSLTAGG